MLLLHILDATLQSWDSGIHKAHAVGCRAARRNRVTPWHARGCFQQLICKVQCALSFHRAEGLKAPCQHVQEPCKAGTRNPLGQGPAATAKV